MIADKMLIILLCLCSFTEAARPNESYFKEFKARFEREYKDHEEALYRELVL